MSVHQIVRKVVGLLHGEREQQHGRQRVRVREVGAAASERENDAQQPGLLQKIALKPPVGDELAAELPKRERHLRADGQTGGGKSTGK